MPTNAQIRKLWASAREIGLAEDELRDKVEEVSGARSISQLTNAQAGAVIDLLVRLGASSGKRTKPSGRRTVEGEILMITPDQRDMIADLRSQLGENWTRDPYFEGACRKLMGKPRPRTAGEAAKTIEMLKRRLEYNRTRQDRGNG